MPNDPAHIPAGSTSPVLFMEQHVFRFLVNSDDTGGQYSTMEIVSEPGSGPGPHIHEDAEESFYVLDGDVTFRLDGRDYEASTGDFIHIPRGTTHQFKVGSRAARLLASFSPAGAEQHFQTLGVPLEGSAVQR